jgi:ribosome-associated protein
VNLSKRYHTEETAILYRPGPQNGESLLSLVTRSLEDDKGVDLVTIDLAGKSTMSDHMVIASGTSSRMVAAMATHLVEKLKERGIRGIGIEGLAKGDWVLVDAGDVIVHLFRPEVREFYALEKMWGVEHAELVRTVQVGGADQAAAVA